MSAVDVFGFVGHVLEGRYRIDGVIGEGGFGVVYKGWHLAFAEPVAVKCLKVPAHFTTEARLAFEERFREEGKLLRKLADRHPGVVRAHDVSVLASHGVPYLVLEWLDGHTLDAALEQRLTSGQGPCSEQEAIELLSPALEVLAVAHQGVIGRAVAHRDIKPENLFVLRAGGLKVLDFGIAKAMQDGESIAEKQSRTSSGFSAFSPLYGAPEQFRPRRFGETGPWTDVHALGLVLSEMVSGRRPLQGGDAIELMEASTGSVRPTPRQLGARVSDGFEALCARALALQPAERFAHAGELLAALRQLPAPAALPAARSATEDLAAYIGSGPTVPVAPSHPAPYAPAGTASPLSAQPALSPRGPDSLGASGLSASSPTAPPARRLPVAAIAAGASAVALLVVGLVASRSPSSPSLAVGGATASATASAGAAGSRAPAPAVSVVTLASAPAGMVRVLAGNFRMGADGEGRTERPVHEVRLSRDFFLDATEVTVAAYLECRQSGRCTATSVHGDDVTAAEVDKFSKWCNEGRPERANHPINCLDREQATAFCQWAGKRLPTEAEWEFAARGQDHRLYPWGAEAPSCDLGNFSAVASHRCGASAGTRPVGSFPAGATPAGALDMAGNVWEWVDDGWDAAAYPTSARVDPLVPARGPQGVLRGGSWDFVAASAKTVTRQPFDRTRGHVSTGVRCARTAG